MTLAHFKPAVPKCWLFAACGVMWSTAGLLMGITGVGWLMSERMVMIMVFLLSGLILAACVFRRVFGGIAEKNIRRLRQLPDQGCLFAFQAWTSYLVIVFMIALGKALTYLPIPNPVLAIVYTAIGGALVLGSFHYYRHLARIMRISARKHSR